MQIAFQELFDKPSSLESRSSLGLSLSAVLSKRVLIQSGMSCISLLLFLSLIIESFLHASSLLLGILTSAFFFSLVAWYLVHIWYESEWHPLLAETIRLRLPQNQPAEKVAVLLFDEAQILRAPHEALVKLPKILLSLPGSKTIQSVLDHTLLFFFWKKKLDCLEALMLASAEARIQVIQTAPLDPKSHAELANTFVTLSQFYNEAKDHKNRYTLTLQLPFPKHTKEVRIKHQQYAHMAVQELTIVSELAQDAIWVLEQLALSFKELKMPEDELQAWQKVLSVDPDDVQALVRSGLLAFELKMPTTGLKAYQHLKELSPMQADEVLAAYKDCLKPEF